jgi:phosphoribosyl 1,2-cyclic phosphodiesterase
LRFASLGSGSEGNALLVETREGGSVHRVLVDCGFGVREAERRLRALGCEPASLAAIVVTHEHGDHVGGVFTLAARYAIPVHLTHGTRQGCSRAERAASLLRIIDPQQCFEVGPFRIEPVPVPHDAREPVQYILDDGRVRLGVLTDLGHGTPHVLRALDRLDALILECNHDEQMLAGNAAYPPSLKQRIAGPWGHLNNEEAGRILGAIDRSRLRTVVAAHLSQQNNLAHLARSALAGAWRASLNEIRVADQAGGFDWLQA